MQPIVSAGESSAVTITGKVRRRKLWRFVGSYGAAEGLVPTVAFALWVDLVFWYSCLYEQFCTALPPIRSQSSRRLNPWRREGWMARELVFVVCSSSAATARASATSKKRVRARSARVS